MVVAFLVLATLAAFIYNTDQSPPENITNNNASNVTTSKKLIDSITGFKWGNLLAKKSTSTNEGESIDNIEKVNNISSSTITKYFNYQKTESGAEVIFKAESGREYKLPLPFKFLTKF